MRVRVLFPAWGVPSKKRRRFVARFPLPLPGRGKFCKGRLPYPAFAYSD